MVESMGPFLPGLGKGGRSVYPRSRGTSCTPSAGIWSMDGVSNHNINGDMKIGEQLTVNAKFYKMPGIFPNILY